MSITDIRVFLSSFLASIIFGIITSGVPYSNIKISLPNLLGRFLFIIKRTERICVLSVIWQISIYILLVTFFILYLLGKIAFKEISYYFEYSMYIFFPIISIFMIIDGVIYELKNKKRF